jgi:hypothetical protein
MKYLLIILISFLVYSCTNNNKTKQGETLIRKDSLQAKPDSFNYSELDLQPSIQHGIVLDTVTLDATKKYLGITIVLPKVSKKDFPEVYTLLKNLLRAKKREFIESLEDDVAYDSALHLQQGYSMWMEPKSLYKNDKVISFAIENGEGYSGMPSSFEFNLINFDVQKKKEIKLEDYFLLKTSSDTIGFAEIVCKSLNWGKPEEVKRYLEFLGPVKFAFDEENVYFFFDRFELFAGGQVGSAKKKYIENYIRPEYRE